jgi:hypothetical protein
MNADSKPGVNPGLLEAAGKPKNADKGGIELSNQLDGLGST